MTDVNVQNFVAANRSQLAALATRLEGFANMPAAGQVADALQLAQAIAAVIRGMLNDPVGYSRAAKDALSRFGGRFLELFDEINDQRPNTRYQALKKLAVPSFRIVIEKIIRTGTVSDIYELPIMRLELSQHLEFETLFSFVTLRNVVTEDIATKTEEINESYKRSLAVSQKIDKWNDQISEYDRRVAKLLEDYNFVGFAKAFSEMLRGVSASKMRSLILLWTIAGFALAPPIAIAATAILLEFRGMPQLLADNQQRLFVLGPVLITYEILCIYFFRVALRSFQSAAAQASQLGLRLAACAFIQQYAEFAKSQKPDTLDKFEALVFGGLAIEPGKVPSTFDGLEQLVAAIRGTKSDMR